MNIFDAENNLSKGIREDCSGKIPIFWKKFVVDGVYSDAENKELMKYLGTCGITLESVELGKPSDVPTVYVIETKEQQTPAQTK